MTIEEASPCEHDMTIEEASALIDARRGLAREGLRGAGRGPDAERGMSGESVEFSRVRSALAVYKVAQAQQAIAVSALNRRAAETIETQQAAAQDPKRVSEALRHRATTLSLEASLERAGAAVFASAADLVDALDAAGFGGSAEVHAACGHRWDAHRAFETEKYGPLPICPKREEG